MLHRYWFVFSFSDPYDLPPGIRVGCGVTAVSVEDAKSLLLSRVFVDSEIPAIRRVDVDVDVSALDVSHVRPNMGDPAVRGVWFPIGFTGSP